MRGRCALRLAGMSRHTPRSTSRIAGALDGSVDGHTGGPIAPAKISGGLKFALSREAREVIVEM